MISKTVKRFGAVIFLAVFATLVSVALFAMATPSQPAASAGYGVYPTVRIVPGLGGTTAYSNTTNQAFAKGSWLPYETVDFYVKIDLTVETTVTVYYQTSADGVNWTASTALLNAGVADSVTTVRANAAGQYYRIVMTSVATKAGLTDISNAPTFLPTVWVVLK